MSDRGISLRTKRKARPTIGPPKPISAPISGPATTLPPALEEARAAAKAPNAVPRPRPQLSEKTSDLVKRRYSSRFTNLPTDFNGTQPPPPSVPAIPQHFVSGRDRARGPETESTLQVDIKALRDPNLHPETYVANILSDASEQDIYEYQQTLQGMKRRNSLDLQQNVYQNRTQFIRISKEADKLKGEMRQLRNLMAELKNNTTALRVATSMGDQTGFNEGLPSTLSKRDKRSSVADRTAMWNSQLQALWKNIEGSQKFLPAAPGRHVIQNAGLWVELDNATWKSRRHMQIILLNDHLLVASRKKKRVEGSDPRQAPSKLVADRCWPLLDIQIVDLAGASESTGAKTKVADAIMVRGVGQESFTYRTDKPDGPEKAALLLNFRKAVEELRRSLRAEIESSNKAQDQINYFASRDPGLLKKSDLLESLSDIKDRPNMLIEVDGKQQNLRWVEGQVDELDIDIALQRFGEAVNRVEKLSNIAKGLKNNTAAQEFIAFKVEERASKLAAIVTRELVDSHNELKKTKQNVSWLTRLGFEDRARGAYLDARSKIITKRSRQCIFEGNLHQYIWEVSFVYFTIIRNTVSNFQQCFPPVVMSACVKWAKEQVDVFNVILTRQLSSAEEGGATWTECMEQAREHAKLLSEVGLDFRAMIGRSPEPTKDVQGPVGLGVN